MTAEPDLYFGTPGSLITIPHPRGGVQTTRVRPSSVFTTATGGARTGRTVDGKRRYTLNWQQLWYDTFADIQAYDQGHMGPGPFVLHDPSQINWLTVNQSASTASRNNTDGFTLVDDPAAVTDNFTRGASALGWGTSTSGHAWDTTVPTTAPFTATGTAGKIALSSVVAAASSFGGLNATGAAGAYASTPDAASLDITGDLDIRVDVTPATWRPAATQVLAGKWNSTGNQRSYLIYVNTTGTIQFVSSANGATLTVNVASTVAVPSTSERLTIRATIDVDNGAAGNTVTFYTGTGGVNGSFTQLGAAVVTGGTTAIFNSTAVLEVASFETGTSSLLVGVVHAMQLRNLIGGTVVANPDFDGQAAGTTSFADTATPAKTWTVNGAASIISGFAAAQMESIGTSGGGLRLGGVSGEYISTPDTAALDITGDIDIRCDLTPLSWTPTATAALVAKWGAAPNRSYLLNLLTDGTLQMAWSVAGTASATLTSTARVPTGYDRLIVRATLDVDNGNGGHTATFYYAIPGGASTTWVQIGDPVIGVGTTSIFSGSLNVEVGSQSIGTLSLLTGVVHSAQILNGIGGSAVANPDFDAQAAGTTSFADAAGRTWTVTALSTFATAIRIVAGYVNTDWDLVFDIYLGITPAVNSIVVNVDLPYINDYNFYRAKMSFDAGGTIAMGIFKAIGGLQTTVLATSTIGTFPTGAQLRVRVQRANGSCRTKLWIRTNTEPADWDIDVADTATTTLALPGGFRIEGYRLTGNTDTTAVLTFDNLELDYLDATSSIASSATLVDRGPRSLAWTQGQLVGGPSAVTITLDSPTPTWPGIPVIANQAVMFSFTIRGGSDDPIVTITPQLVWYDINGAVISTTSGTPVASSSGAWQAVSVSGTPPATAVYLLAKIEVTSGESAGSIVYFSRFQLERGSTITEWRPGTGIFPVQVMSLNEQWPWQASAYRESPVLVLQESGA